MRLRPGHRPAPPTWITVGELVACGLGRHPEAWGVFWPDSHIFQCRHHATNDVAVQVLAAVRRSSAVAQLVTPDTPAARRRHCIGCALSPEGKADG